MTAIDSATEPAAGPDATARTAPEILTDARDLVEPALREAATGLPDPMHRIAGYHFGWCDAEGRPASGDGGKALRPALVLLAAEAVGGTARAALPAAVAVELVHNFSLLHDDVMDGDTTRRHRPTAWSVFGPSPAVLAGDALLTLAFEVLASDGGPRAAEAGRMLGAAVQALVGGQAADLSFERRNDVGLDECTAMACGKTGALLGCCTALGALLGGAERARVDALLDFGADMGLAFQIADDLLGIWGDPAATGKPVHSDLRSRKKSLPVVAALTSGTDAGERLGALLAGEGPMTDATAARAADLVEAAGGRAWCEARAAELLNRSSAALDAAALREAPRRELTALARLAAHRDG